MNIAKILEANPEIQFIPINDKKFPLVKEWEKTKGIHNFDNAHGIGLVCGAISGNVEAIDIDCKYDITGTLFIRYKIAISLADKNLLKKLVVQKTRSNGYHFIYRCEKIEGNKKLANREATDEEKKSGDKFKVLIETRGDRGYIAIAETPGYEFIYRTLPEIETITIDERETLLNTARSFNEVVKEYVPTHRNKKQYVKGLSSFEDYNNRAEVVELLEKHGWKTINRKANKVNLLRPGSTTAATSGNYDEARNWFSVFSTSTEFQSETAYLPYAVFAILECKGDFPEASKRLYDLGFGDREDKIKENNTHIPSRVDVLSDNCAFVATGIDYDDYLAAWRNGTFKMGFKTGFSELDKHFLFKTHSLVVINGHDNVGKSTTIWYLALLSSLLHGWRWIIYSSENSTGGVIKKLIEFYWCKGIKLMTDNEFKEAKEYVEKYFIIIKSDQELYNYKDILNMATIAMKKSEYHGILIDPYNSLKIEMNNASKLSTHEYHYEAISEIKLFTKQSGVSIYINCHAVTNALRLLGGDKMPTAPQKADTEGGGKFSNKADDFITIHRKVQSPDEWMWTEFHIRKIKETETGGRTTPINAPIKIRAVKGLTGFEFSFPSGFIENPVMNYHLQKSKASGEIVIDYENKSIDF